MGTRARVVLYANDVALARRAADAALDRIAALEAVMSDYRDDSELMRLCAAGGGVVSDDLRRVLVAARDVSAQSDGAFDVTIGPIVKLWRKRVMPTPADLAKVGWRKVRIEGTRVRLEPGMQLDLGGIGKGFAADEALQAMRAHGVQRALVDIGGDLAVGKGPWRVRVAGELRALENCGVAASGDTERFIEIDGVRYSHLVDPRTGIGLTHRMRVTVIAPTGTEADAWASAASVMGRAPPRRAGFTFILERARSGSPSTARR
ncbi:MAG: FAD:protein FMN transferase [Planctomycetota bacterium]|nr:FAD:protein FMN transferase [Planctomycetota bacterium]